MDNEHKRNVGAGRVCSTEHLGKPVNRTCGRDNTVRVKDTNSVGVSASSQIQINRDSEAPLNGFGLAYQKTVVTNTGRIIMSGTAEVAFSRVWD